MTRMKKALPWVIGLLTATAMFISLKLITYLRFENSDDILMVKAFMGFEGGIPAAYSTILHTFLSYGLGWLSTLFPGIAWFSLFQLFLLWFSTALIVKCAVQCACEHDAPLWAGLGTAFLLTLVIAVFACARINFTTTAALAGTAAVAQLCTLRLNDKKVFGQCALSTLMLLGCYSLRAESLIAVLPFCLLALGWRLTGRRAAGERIPRAFWAAILAGTLCLGLFAGVRAAENQQPEIKELLAFHEAKAAPMDYDESILLNASDETLERIGWTRSELALVRQWYFMDQNITADAMRQLSAASAPRPFLQRAASALKTLIQFYGGNARYLASACILLLLTLVVLPSECLSRRQALLSGANAALRAVTLVRILIPLAAVLGTGLMLIYLAYQGRFLSRAADCALFPATALLGCLAASSIGRMTRTGASPAVRRRRAAALVLSALIAMTGTAYGCITLRVLREKPDVQSIVRESDLEIFALENPEKLILRTPDLLRDTRLLPDVSAGLPGNIMIWGDWYCRTPSWYRQLALYGLDGRHFTAADFLKPQLLFVTADDAPPEALLAYISEGAGRAVTAVMEGAAGELHFFRFE